MLINLFKELSFMGLGGQEKKAESSGGDFGKWLGQSQAAKSALNRKEEIALADLLDSLEGSNLVAFLLIHFGGSDALGQEMNQRAGHSPQSGINLKVQSRGGDVYGSKQGFKQHWLKRAGAIATKLTGEKSLQPAKMKNADLNAIIKMLKKLSQKQEQIESVLRSPTSKMEPTISDKHKEAIKKTITHRGKAELTLEDGSWRVKRFGRARKNGSGTLVSNNENGNRTKFSVLPQKTIPQQTNLSEKAKSKQGLPGSKGDIPSFGNQGKRLNIGQPIVKKDQPFAIVKKDQPFGPIGSKEPVSKTAYSPKNESIQVDHPIKELNSHRKGLLNQKLAILSNQKGLAANSQPIRLSGQKRSWEQAPGKSASPVSLVSARRNVDGQKLSVSTTGKGVKGSTSNTSATNSGGDVKLSEKPNIVENGLKEPSRLSKNERSLGNALGKGDQPILKPEPVKVVQSVVHKDLKVKANELKQKNTRNKSTERPTHSLKHKPAEVRSDKQVPTEGVERRGENPSGAARKGMIENSLKNLGSKVLASFGPKPSMAVPVGDQTIGHGENHSEEVALQGFKPVAEVRTVMTRIGLEGPQGQSVLRQVADHLSASVRQAPREVVIKLEPEALGKLKVKVTVELEQVSAQVFAENSKVVSLLKGSQSELQQQLKDQGFDLNSFDVRQGFQSDQERSHQSHEKETLWSTEGQKGELGIDPAAHTDLDRPIHFVSDRSVNVMA